MFRFRKAIAVITVLFFVAGLVNTVYASKLSKFFKDIDWKDTMEKTAKTAGIVYLVKEFGDDLNRAINKLMTSNGAEVKETTKVVPIFTFGKRGEVGACQVSGSAERIEQVKAVYAIDGSLDRKHRFAIQALVPCSSINPTKLHKVNSVGVTGVIDYNLSN